MRATKVLLIAVLMRASWAKAGPDAGLPGAYLNYSGGAAVTGMGRAYVGLAEGLDALTWNPAGLGYLRPHTVGLLHTQTSEEANLDYIGYAQPIYRLGGVGLAYTRLDSGSLPQTDEFNREVGEFRDVQQTMMVGYGFSPVTRFSLGGAFKFSSQSLAGSSAKGWGADIGFLTQVHRYLRAGVRVQNVVAPAFKYETATDQFPRLATLGLATRMFADRMALTLDMDKALDAPQGLKWRFGAEGTFFRVAKLRAGFDFEAREFTFGLGYLWGRTGFDYSSSSNQSGLSHRFGLNHAFGGYGVALSANPLAFSPMGLIKKTTFGIKVNHAKSIHEWTLQIRNQSNDVVHTIRGSGRPPSELTWDGKTGYGMIVAPGNYGCVFTVMDADGRAETTPIQVVRVEYGTPLDTLELSTR